MLLHHLLVPPKAQWTSPLRPTWYYPLESPISLITLVPRFRLFARVEPPIPLFTRYTLNLTPHDGGICQVGVDGFANVCSPVVACYDIGDFCESATFLFMLVWVG